MCTKNNREAQLRQTWVLSQISTKPNFLESERERHSKTETQQEAGCSTPLGGGQKGLWAGVWGDLGTDFDEELMLAERSGVSHDQSYSLLSWEGHRISALLFWNLIWWPQPTTMSWTTARCSKLGSQGWFSARSWHRMQLEIFRWGEGWGFFFIFSNGGLYMDIKE